VNLFQLKDPAARRPERDHRALEAFAKSSETSPKGMTGYVHWTDLVQRIQTGQTDGMEELYEIFSKGVRFYLRRNTGTQDVEDRMHDLFLLVVQAIRRGELREPDRLMGFVQTVARCQVAAHIRSVVVARKEAADFESGREVTVGGSGQEQAAISNEREELVKKVLSELSDRDREVLMRFYLKEQSPSQICKEMNLTETQFRLGKSRAKSRLGELEKKRTVGRGLVSTLFASRC
jgi:RNA polymerase sigma-70 factor (ECF subfamily)